MNARDEILSRLSAVPKKSISPRPDLPSLRELSLTQEERIETFSRNLRKETGVVHRVPDNPGALDRLTQIAGEEGLKTVLASEDDVLATLNLSEWGKINSVRVLTAAMFPSRDSFKDAVFTEADAGITGADFAVAESGTLVLVHNPKQPRLISLAPILHIAIVPAKRVVAVYEEAIEHIFGRGGNLPSQISFITGPSTTADIESTLFKGMHGPKKIHLILVG